MPFLPSRIKNSLSRLRSDVREAHHPIAHLIKRNLLRLVEVAIEQDADILSKLYTNTPQHIKLNNEVGMDWVRRNYASFPAIVEPNFSRQ